MPALKARRDEILAKIERLCGDLAEVNAGEYVAEKSGLDTADKDAMLHLVSNVGKAMGHYRKNGHVIGQRRGNMTWWRLP